MKRLHEIYIIICALFIMCAGPPVSNSMAQADGDDLPFKDAEFYIEFNASGIDAGVQVFLDGDNWRWVSIVDPDGRTIFQVRGRKTLGWLGLTELFFESVEPEISDLPLEEFLSLFPEGDYEFEGKTNDGVELESEAEFTHVIPCGPEVTPADGTVVPDGLPVIISWEEVTQVVDPAVTDAAGEVICVDPDDDLEIDVYQVIVESEAGDLVADLPGNAWKFTLPEELIVAENALYRFEVLAKEESGNQTITEGFFCTGGLSTSDCMDLSEMP